MVEEIVVEEVKLGTEEDLDGEPGVENTPEEGAVSDIIGSPEGVVLVDPSDPPSTPPAQPSTPPVEEDLADGEIAVEEEPGVVNAPEEGREEEVEMSTEEIIEQNVEAHQEKHNNEKVAKNHRHFNRSILRPYLRCLCDYISLLPFRW